MAETLNVKVRGETGSSRMRRLRHTGVVPAILYGHGEANVNLAVPQKEILSAVKHGGKLVSLKGDVSDSALVRTVQWDVFGKEIIHLDLMRVDLTEMVETTVSLELKGTAAGAAEGGVLQFITHEIEIECPAASIPDKIVVSVVDLKLNNAIHVSDVKLPEGAKLITHGEDVVVQCVTPRVEEEAPAAAPEAATGAEPELIKKEKPVEEEAEE
jgi:large subunit ribosomal protein L25